MALPAALVVQAQWVLHIKALAFGFGVVAAGAGHRAGVALVAVVAMAC